VIGWRTSTTDDISVSKKPAGMKSGKNEEWEDGAKLKGTFLKK
jgi:hypothetical protein